MTAFSFTYAPSLSFLESWRLANFGSSANAGNAENTADPDGDGRTNLKKYAALSDPRNTASFSMATPVYDGAGLHIRFTAKAGRRYRLEASGELTGVWTGIQSRAATASQSDVDWLVSPAAQTRQYFRVAAEVP